MIKEKELVSENCGKLLYIISEKLSFGKSPCKKELERLSRINEEILLNKITNMDYITNTSNINNIIQLNDQELSAYIRKMNEQFLNSLRNDNFIANTIMQYLNNNNYIINNENINNIFYGQKISK